MSLSKLGLAIRLAPPDLKTSTSSTMHSPPPCKCIWNWSGLDIAPLSSTPVAWIVVQIPFDSSLLSAQLEGCDGSARVSINSRLLPPPSAHCPQRPPLLYSTSAT